MTATQATEISYNANNPEIDLTREFECIKKACLAGKYHAIFHVLFNEKAKAKFMEMGYFIEYCESDHYTAILWGEKKENRIKELLKLIK